MGGRIKWTFLTKNLKWPNYAIFLEKCDSSITLIDNYKNDRVHGAALGCSFSFTVPFDFFKENSVNLGIDFFSGATPGPPMAELSRLFIQNPKWPS